MLPTKLHTKTNDKEFTSDKKKLTGGASIYAEIPFSKHAASEVGKKELQRQAKFLMDVAVNVASASSTNEVVTEKETDLALTEMVNLNKERFHNIFIQAKMNTNTVMTSTEAVSLQSLLRLPTNKVRNLRHILTNLNMNILPSERKMRGVQKSLVSHVHDVESGLMGLKRTAKDNTVSPRAFVRVKCLKSYIEEIINKEHFNLVESDIFNNKIWLLFSGDKGGNHMKFNVEMVNSNIGGSVDNVHIYCMFEATDSPENMWKVWLPYREQIKEFQKEGYSIITWDIKVHLLVFHQQWIKHH